MSNFRSHSDTPVTLDGGIVNVDSCASKFDFLKRFQLLAKYDFGQIAIVWSGCSNLPVATRSNTYGFIPKCLSMGNKFEDEATGILYTYRICIVPYSEYQL